MAKLMAFQKGNAGHKGWINPVMGKKVHTLWSSELSGRLNIFLTEKFTGRKIKISGFDNFIS